MGFKSTLKIKRKELIDVLLLNDEKRKVYERMTNKELEDFTHNNTDIGFNPEKPLYGFNFEVKE